MIRLHSLWVQKCGDRLIPEFGHPLTNECSFWVLVLLLFIGVVHGTALIPVTPDAFALAVMNARFEVDKVEPEVRDALPWEPRVITRIGDDLARIRKFNHPVSRTARMQASTRGTPVCPVSQAVR